MEVQSMIIWTAVSLWFCHGWYMNIQLDKVHKKLDAIAEGIDKQNHAGKVFVPGFGYQDSTD